MDITGIGSLVSLGTTIIDKIWPDKTEADKAKLRLFELQQAGEFKEIEAALEMSRQQTAVNVAEAQSGDNFRGGWRPFTGWVCAFGLGYAAIFRPIIIGLVRLQHPEFDLPEAGGETLTTILLGMLGLGGMRTFEKVRK
jgi:hypothetical protein